MLSLLLCCGSVLGNDDLASIIAKETAAIKQALNFGSDKEWAIDVGEPVKDKWAEDFVSEQFEPMYNTMMEKNFEDLEELTIDGDGQDPKLKYKELFAELRRRGINPDDFGGLDDDDGDGDGDGDDGAGLDYSDAGRAAKKGAGKTAKEKEAERLAWAMLTKASNEKGSLQKTFDSALGDMQDNINSKNADDSNFLHNRKKTKNSKKNSKKKKTSKKGAIKTKGKKAKRRRDEGDL